jgi:hypothetical protein
MDENSKVFAKKLEGFVGNEVDIFPLVNLFALDTVCGKYFFENVNQCLTRIS